MYFSEVIKNDNKFELEEIKDQDLLTQVKDMYNEGVGDKDDLQ